MKTMNGLMYIDTKKATLNALKDYPYMQFRHKNSPSDREAGQYIEWFEPAWLSLSDDEQELLLQFIENDHGKSDSKDDRRDVKRKSRSLFEARISALKKLSVRLYGF